MIKTLTALTFGAHLVAQVASAGIVINEVMYHPPDDRDDLQWIELLNHDSKPIDLAGWSLTQGIQFTFTNRLELPPGGLVIVTRDLGAFRSHYGTQLPAVGNFKGRLNHSGERIEVSDPSRKTVDALEYGDSDPWPTSPDGGSTSLERIVAAGSSEDPHNWAPSRLPELRKTSGSPGQVNSSTVTNLPPVIRPVAPPESFVPANTPIPVTVEVSDPDGIDSVRVLYRTIPILGTLDRSKKANTAETAVALSRTAGDPLRGTYSASIPPQPSGSLVRFRTEAVDRSGSRRWLPHPDDLRPAWSVLAGSLTNDAAIPFAFLHQLGSEERPGQSLRTMEWGPRGPRGKTQPSEPARGEAALVYVEPGSSQIRLFDYIRISPRGGGWKVRLQKDRLLDGMSTVNVLFEHHPRYVLAEHMAYEVFRSAGVATPNSGHWRTWYNGRPLGYHLVVEQPNGTFLRRVGRDTEGDVFKLIWYGGDLVGQHEKKNNPESGHADLVDTVETLNKLKDSEQWKEIEKRFNVDVFVNYYAVNMLIQNWDGFFNNFFLYRSPGKEGRWEILPWDEDKTWGDYDGASAQYDWYSMPLTFGMAGDQPKMSLSERFLGRGGPFGGQSWWRQPGWFSGPLLANPEFRSRFKNRLQQLLATEFTPEKMEKPIARLERSLGPEVQFRAWFMSRNRGPGVPFEESTQAKPREMPGVDSSNAQSQFQRHIDSFRRQVKGRRDFLLNELKREP